jgi:hypothetical protein
MAIFSLPTASPFITPISSLSVKRMSRNIPQSCLSAGQWIAGLWSSLTLYVSPMWGASLVQSLQSTGGGLLMQLKLLHGSCGDRLLSPKLITGIWRKSGSNVPYFPGPFDPLRTLSSIILSVTFSKFSQQHP